jgi:hypothetical protein
VSDHGVIGCGEAETPKNPSYLVEDLEGGYEITIYLESEDGEVHGKDSKGRRYFVRDATHLEVALVKRLKESEECYDALFAKKERVY